MKHLHGLELYTGARLVGEAVAAYLKERAANHDKHVAARKQYEEWQKKVANSPFIFEPFKKVTISRVSFDDLPLCQPHLVPLL
jgi:hypothetical protein